MFNIWTTIRRSAPVVLGLVLVLGQMAPLNVQRTPASVQASKIEISEYELAHEIQARLFRVPEYKFLLQESQRMGVTVYLFGGTAAAFAHYVRWDLMREKGDSRFQEDRFDYDFTNIYRSNQDLDIVVDGDANKVAELQGLLQVKFPYLQGNKDAWEVRSLREKYHDKMALLNDPDFLNQSTDSNSTGMIEITDKSKLVVHDLHDWNNPDSQFLKDVSEGKIHYYSSDLHNTTAKAKAGQNPLIFSAIRLLIKAVQFELEIRPEDLIKIKNIIQDFKPEHYAAGSYVNNWIEKNAKKLVQNAVNIEYSMNLMDQLGLRTKLVALNNNKDVIDSMAWWLSKEPLRSFPLGEGSGKTARELGLTIVAHETNNLMAHESITRAHTGDPNVLKSRTNAAGEAAVFGEGFYTRIGREGARGTGLTVRFEMRPEARQGTDFTKEVGGDYVVIKNKNALQVIQESLNIGVVEYLNILSQEKLDSSDRAILERLKRRISNKLFSSPQEDVITVNNIIQTELNNAKPGVGSKMLFFEWISMPISHQNEGLRNRVMAFLWKEDISTEMAYHFLKAQDDFTGLSAVSGKSLAAIIKKLDRHQSAIPGGYFIKLVGETVLSKPGMVGNAVVLDALVTEGYRSAAISGFSHIKDFTKYPEARAVLINMIYEMSRRTFGLDFMGEMTEKIFSRSDVTLTSDILDALAKNHFSSSVMAALENAKDIRGTGFENSIFESLDYTRVTMGPNKSKFPTFIGRRVLARPDMIGNTAVINGLIQNGFIEEAIEGLSHMPEIKDEMNPPTNEKSTKKGFFGRLFSREEKRPKVSKPTVQECVLAILRSNLSPEILQKFNEMVLPKLDPKILTLVKQAVAGSQSNAVRCDAVLNR